MNHAWPQGHAEGRRWTRPAPPVIPQGSRPCQEQRTAPTKSKRGEPHRIGKLKIQPPEPCLPTAMEMRQRIQQLGLPRTPPDWAARQQEFFPRTAMLPAGWTRLWDIVTEQVTYCRVDGTGHTNHFPEEAVEGVIKANAATTSRRSHPAGRADTKRARARMRRKRAKQATSSSDEVTGSASGKATELSPESCGQRTHTGHQGPR